MCENKIISTPIVSVIVPVYNAEQYIGECLDSIIHQTLGKIEIICIDDGSKDASLAIMKQYAQKDSRLSVISKENTGYGQTMNMGIDLAKGEYIGIVESDDVIAADMYEKLVAVTKSQELEAVKSNFFVFQDINGKRESRERRQFKFSTYYNRVLSCKQDLKVFDGALVNPPSIYKKSFLTKHNIRFNETPGAAYQDNGFIFQVFIWADHIYFIEDCLYYIRRDNPNSSIYNKGNVYAMSREYAFMREKLMQDAANYERYKYQLMQRKYNSYLFTFRRIAEEYRREFVHHISEEYKEALKAGEVKKEGYFSDGNWKVFLMIANDPDQFFEIYNKRM